MSKTDEGYVLVSPYDEEAESTVVPEKETPKVEDKVEETPAVEEKVEDTVEEPKARRKKPAKESTKERRARIRRSTKERRAKGIKEAPKKEEK